MVVVLATPRLTNTGLSTKSLISSVHAIDNSISARVPSVQDDATVHRQALIRFRAEPFLDYGFRGVGSSAKSLGSPCRSTLSNDAPLFETRNASFFSKGTIQICLPTCCSSRTICNG